MCIQITKSLIKRKAFRFDIKYFLNLRQEHDFSKQNKKKEENPPSRRSALWQYVLQNVDFDAEMSLSNKMHASEFHPQHWKRWEFYH